MKIARPGSDNTQRPIVLPRLSVARTVLGDPTQLNSAKPESKLCRGVNLVVETLWWLSRRADRPNPPTMKRCSGFRKNDGFTLVEIIVASLVLGLVFISSIATLTYGFKLLENARFGTLASQVIQSEIETLRLKNWSQISALPAKEAITLSSEMSTAGFNKFSGWRVISTVRPKTKRIVVGVQWTAQSGRVHTRRYTTFMTKDGLNDFYYTSL